MFFSPYFYYKFYFIFFLGAENQKSLITKLSNKSFYPLWLHVTPSILQLNMWIHFTMTSTARLGRRTLTHYLRYHDGFVKSWNSPFNLRPY